MRNLRLPQGPPMAPYDRILEAKQAGEVPRMLRGLRSKVLERYEAYARLAPRLETLPAARFEPGEAGALVHCYDSGTEPLAALKVAIRDCQDSESRPFCPYCGINAPDTFEHYLPRSEFPEYSVCAYNLMPACGTCNTLKGSKWLDEQGRRFLHLYYDRLPDDVRWLSAKVRVEGGVPFLRFELQRPQGLDATLYALIESHYKALRLCARYGERSTEVVSEARSSVVLTRSHPERVRMGLGHQAEFLAQARGRNYWKTVALAALADSPPFIDLACGAAPPQAPTTRNS